MCKLALPEYFIFVIFLSDVVWEGTIAFSATFLILFVVILGMCWRKVRMQRKKIQSLSEDEIKEFRLGNSDILGNSQYLDTQELLQAIPYNDEYEISSKRLYIGNV